MPRRKDPSTTRPAGLALAWALAGVAGVADAQTVAAQRVEVIGTSPLPGQGVGRDTLPYTTQVIRRSEIDAAQAQNTSDLLARRIPGVQVNDIQGSTYQGDLTYRGFRASGILGTAQGISVYLDGVRVNEPFGDVVNWDMVPEFALQSISLVPGANPAFGLNTLGGAIALATATGASAPGLRGELSLGSFGRKRVDMSHGGTHEGGWSHFVGAGLFDEAGWRDHSDGSLGTVLAKVGRTSDAGDFSLGLLAGRSRLVGNGLVPLVTLVDDEGSREPSLGAVRRAAVYTHPDLSRNRVTQLTGQWRSQRGSDETLEALVYLRDSRRSTINGDEAEEDEDGEAAAAAQAGTRGRVRALDAEDDEPNASFNRTATRQRSGGMAWATSRRSGPHQWQVGASLDHAEVGYEQTEQDGVFDATRGVHPFPGSEAELSAEVDGHASTLGLYATDTWQIARGTHLTGALRHNLSRVSNALVSRDDESGELEARPRERFTYRSWNPALGIAHAFAPGLTLFGNAARNTRVPTVIELGCADPQEPCRLPAGLQADPYLKQVVSTTVEAGARFAPTGLGRGSATFYRTDNRDDILFRSVSVTGQLGYFANFPRTRHQGFDLEWSGRAGSVDLGLAYSFLDATYEAEGTLRMGERNVRIGPGTRIAGLPRQILKLSADWSIGHGLVLGADLQAVSGRVVAGNEDGLLEDDGDEEVDLELPGYAVLALRASWKPTSPRGVEFFARVSNLGDKRYASFGALAETLFDADGELGDEADALFVAPGAPRAFTLGLRWAF